jgi:hypothetical protein
MAPPIDPRFVYDYERNYDHLPPAHRDPRAPGPQKPTDGLRVQAWEIGSIYGAQGDYREARQWFDLACRASMAYVGEKGATRPSWPRFVESETPMISWGFLRMEVGQALRAARLCTRELWTHPLAGRLAQSLGWYADVAADEITKFKATNGRSKVMAYTWAECVFLVACSGFALRNEEAIARARSMVEDLGGYAKRRVKGPVPPLEWAEALLRGDGPGFVKAFVSAEHYVTPPVKPTEYIQVFDARMGTYSSKPIPPAFPPHLSFFLASDVARYLQANETLGALGPLHVNGIPEGLELDQYFA